MLLQTKAVKPITHLATSGPAGQRGLLQRKCACGGTPGPSGECAACRRKRLHGAKRLPLQPKLAINRPNDQYEQEADRVADQVMRVTAPPVHHQGPRAVANGEGLQAKPTGHTLHRMIGERATAPPIVHAVLRGQKTTGGQPLDVATRGLMETRFGHDFSRVRVHTDGHAAAAAHAVNALAYTVGNHITFGASQYQPQSSNGRRLLAHELTHVIQQTGAPRQAPTLQRKLRIDEGAATGPSLKATAERLAGRPLTPADDGLQLADAAPTGGSPTIASFLQRAIASQRTYRLRWGTTPAGSAQAGRVAEEDGEIVITIDRAKVGEFTFTLDEIVAEQLVAAVTHFDRSTQPAPTATSQTSGQPLAPVTADELLSAPLTMKNPEEKQGRLRAYVDQELTHLTPAQRRLVYEVGSRAEGVPLTEIIRGVESNTPFRTKQTVENGRVSATYVDPRGLPPTADRFDMAAFFKLLADLSRVVTFVPGADEATAEAANLPKTGESCTPDEQQTAQNSCCTPAMLAEFRGHLSTAQAAVARTIQRLEGAQLIGCQARRHLGEQSTETDLHEVADRLRLAQSELLLARHGWKCRERGSGVLGCDRRVVDGNEGFVGGSVRYGQTDILICVNNSAPFTTWTTILHEVMHRVGVYGAETYQGDSGYPGNHPLENADSYAGLVATMGGSDWSPCRPWPVDVRGIVGSNLGPGFVLGARIEATPLGPGLRVVDWTLGVNFLWSPQFGVVPEAGDAPRNLVGRGYVGAETGVRLTLPRTHGALVFDAAAGLGALFPGETKKPDLGLSARVGGRFRFGTGLSGPEVGLELSRLQSLAERGRGDWVVGVTAGFHFGRSGTRR